MGILWLLSLWGMSMQGRLGTEKAESVEIAGLYWHFVDVVWIVIFTIIYLVPQPGT
jgi:cytochrome c oxidase subunit 3/cytochrome o ubiquinol oxidase subunit 3